MQALDELVTRWRKNPDPESTLALCAHLGTSAEAELMREVASIAEARHRDNHTVMLSVGRMYLDGGLLAEAQAALIQAGRLQPGGAEAYRYLGEVLLRRGDAIRAEKTLAKAIQLGDDDAETHLWHERAVVYVALQKRQGLAAVADEVARTAPHQPSIPAPTLSPFDRLEHDSLPSVPRTARRSRPPLAGTRSSGRRRSSAAPAGRRRGSTPPPGGFPLAAKSPPQDTLMMGGSPLPMPPREGPPPAPPFFPVDEAAPPAPAASPVRTGLAGPPSSARRRALEGQTAASLAELLHESAGAALGDRPSALLTQPDIEPAGDPFNGTFSDAPGPDETLLADAPPALPRPAPATTSAAAAPSSRRGPTAAPSMAPASRQSQRPVDELRPTPEVVLGMLARVGLYEQESSVMPAWEAAPRPAPRRLWILSGALVLAAGLGLGAYQYAVGVQGERLARAQELGVRLASALDSGSRAQLAGSEADFQVLFELDSRGRETALLWLENRVLQTLLTGDTVSGIESALERARSVGVEEPQLAFARLASALAASDLPGAFATTVQWDARAKDDALYQMLAGVVFERAGSADALDRYVAATRLQPDLKLAQALAARLALLELGPVAAKPIVDVARARLGPGLVSDILGGLEWATTPFNGTSGPALPPPEALGDLSPMMRETASAVVAVKAQREGHLQESLAAFGRALGPASTPSMAAWVGYRALEAGDLEIAHRAAVTAVQLSVQHKGAQALAARIALAEGRLDAARDTVRGVDPSSRDALLLEAVSAYENLQARDVARMLGSLPADPALTPTLEALQGIEKVIGGTARLKDERLNQLASPRKLWGSVVAVDLALDSGRLGLARSIVESRKWDAQVPAYAARMMRLERYEGHGAAALELAPALSDPKRATPRSVAELVLSLVGEHRAAAATTALHDLNGAAGGLAPWLEALVESGLGREPSAARSLAALELPDKAQPALLQVVALRALSAARDRRAKGYHAKLEARFKDHPDVLEAGRALGLSK